MAKKRRLPASTRRAGSADSVDEGGSSHTSLHPSSTLVELERAQFANELHDDVMPLIFAASAAVSSLIERSELSDQQREQRLHQINDWLADAMSASRRLLTQTYPPQFAGANWTQAVRDSVDRLTDGCETDIQWQLADSANQTSIDVAFAAYRIVIESVRNAITHGNAPSVKVSAERKNGVLLVETVDLGHGFDLNSVAEDRFGIRSMTSRARMVGGTLEMHSSQGGPTRVVFRCPANPESGQPESGQPEGKSTT